MCDINSFVQLFAGSTSSRGTATLTHPSKASKIFLGSITESKFIDLNILFDLASNSYVDAKRYHDFSQDIEKGDFIIFWLPFFANLDNPYSTFQFEFAKKQQLVLGAALDCHKGV
jgi:hypothetical protein